MLPTLRTLTRYPHLCTFSLTWFAIAASFLINGEMAWIFVGVTLFLGLVLFIAKSFTLSFKCLSMTTSLTVSKENITNMRVVRSYVKEQEDGQIQEGSRRIYKMFMRAIRVVVMSNPAMMLSMYASFLIFLGLVLILSLSASYLHRCWLPCSVTPWPSSSHSWCSWWSLSCCLSLWPL